MYTWNLKNLLSSALASKAARYTSSGSEDLSNCFYDSETTRTTSSPFSESKEIVAVSGPGDRYVFYFPCCVIVIWFPSTHLSVYTPAYKTTDHRLLYRQPAKSRYPRFRVTVPVIYGAQPLRPKKTLISEFSN